ncbi:MAG: HDIG domain-containing metalloprotein [Candidatus Andersenbacteria bacterium]
MSEELKEKTRADAWQLLNQYTKNQNLIKHALAVEAAMRYYARHFGENEEVWGLVGLLHDFDYEQHPSLEEHPYKGQEILTKLEYPEVIKRGIMAHAPHTGTPRTTLMEKTIFAVDELAGFIVAVALVRPSRKLADVDVKSVKKKLKQKKFAENVSREDITQGAQELGFSPEEHIEHALQAMKSVADPLGL